MGQTRLKHGDHRGRGVDTSDGVTGFAKMSCDWRSSSAADVQDRSACRDQRAKATQPPSLGKVILAQPLVKPGFGVPFVQVNNAIGVRAHSKILRHAKS